MNAVEPRLGVVHDVVTASHVLQRFCTARVRNGQRPADVATDTVATVVARDAVVVVVRGRKISNLPVGEIRSTATLELHGCNTGLIHDLFLPISTIESSVS